MTYKNMAEALTERKVFKGNSVSTTFDGDTYVVYSYSTAIYEENSKGNYFNLRKYSSTTSRIQGIIKQVFGVIPGKSIFSS